MLRPDDTIPLLRGGYGYLARRRREGASDVVPLRLFGRRALAVCGPQWAEKFYDESLVRRAGALPPTVKATLLGEGGVHGLDGPHHRHRKRLFLSQLGPERARALADGVALTWDETAAGWRPGRELTVFDVAAEVLLRAVWTWCGLDLRDIDVPRVTRDCVAMVDGFGSVGRRFLRGRAARRSAEAYVASVVDDVRSGRRTAPSRSPLDELVRHREIDGSPLSTDVAAVELLNLVRPTVATAWFAAYAAHALQHRPEHRSWLSGHDQVRAFGHETRRFYPFAPFMGGRARGPLQWGGVAVPDGALVLLDLYGQNHSTRLWGDPEVFRPERFLGCEPDPWTLVPHGAGYAEHGHRCPGEPAVVGLLDVLVSRLAALEWSYPEQDDRIDLRRMPARPSSGIRVHLLRAPAPA